MVDEKERERELAYRFDLFIAPDWSARFDQMVAEHFTYPEKGRFLEVNCGTGTRVLDHVGGSGSVEVVGTDIHPQRLELARAKATVVQAERYAFVEMDPRHMTFPNETFDCVVADCTMEPPGALDDIAAEVLRVARPGSPVVFKLQLQGTLDEFFSIYWEALHVNGLSEDLWGRLDAVMSERLEFEKAMSVLRAAGARKLQAHRVKQEWQFESGAEFLASPLISDLFLEHWLAIVPDAKRAAVLAGIEQAIDSFRADGPFDVSAKALVVTGLKE